MTSTTTTTARTRKAAKQAPAKTVHVLRTCAADMTSHNGFRWPESGSVEAPDWKPTKACGNGLHGLLWGIGDAGLLDWSEDARWLVVAVDATTLIDLEGKVKYPRGDVVFCGDRVGATKYITEHGAADKPVHGSVRSAGDRGTATAGDRGTATAGYRGTATAGDSGTATAGDEGLLIIQRWSGKRYGWHAASVGENSIEPNVAYRLDDDGHFVRVEEEKAEAPAGAATPAADDDGIPF